MNYALTLGIMQPIYIDLTHYFTDLVIQGNNAETFLQGQLTCDLNQLDQTHSSLGAHCDLKGRVVSLFRVYRIANQWHLTVPTSAADIAVKALQHYARFSKVTITKHSPLRYGLLGDSVTDILTTIGIVLPTEPNHLANTNTITNTLIIRHLGFPCRFELIGELPAALSMLTTGTLEDWQAAQINAGEAFINETNSGLFLPHELNP